MGCGASSSSTAVEDREETTDIVLGRSPQQRQLQSTTPGPSSTSTGAETAGPTTEFLRVAVDASAAPRPDVLSLSTPLSTSQTDRMGGPGRSSGNPGHLQHQPQRRTSQSTSEASVDWSDSRTEASFSIPRRPPGMGRDLRELSEAVGIDADGGNRSMDSPPCTDFSIPPQHGWSFPGIVGGVPAGHSVAMPGGAAASHGNHHRPLMELSNISVLNSVAVVSEEGSIASSTAAVTQSLHPQPPFVTTGSSSSTVATASAPTLSTESGSRDTSSHLQHPAAGRRGTTTTSTTVTSDLSKGSIASLYSQKCDQPAEIDSQQ